MTHTFTPQEDAEDLALVLREAREMQDASAAELTRRASARFVRAHELWDGQTSASTA